MENKFIRVDEVAKELDVSKPYSLSENQPTFTGVELINIHGNQEVL